MESKELPKIKTEVIIDEIQQRILLNLNENEWVSVSDLCLGGRGEIQKALFKLVAHKFIIERVDPSGEFDGGVNRFGILPPRKIQCKLTDKGVGQKNILLANIK